MNQTLTGLPGETLVDQGLADLASGELETQASWLVAMARTKLRGLGLDVPPSADDVQDAELKLYALLLRTHSNPYREYNALRARLGRFERALEARVMREKRAADADM